MSNISIEVRRRQHFEGDAFKKTDGANVNDIILEAHKQDGAGIIYCLTKRQTETLCKELNTQLDTSLGNVAGFINSDCNHKMREEVSRRWRDPDDSLRIICATDAFGLGIDHNVRFVFHMSPPLDCDQM